MHISASVPAKIPGQQAPRAQDSPTPPSEDVEVFDLARIDTPVEALLMPVVDLVAAMVVGNGERSPIASVSVKAGGQSLEYRATPSANGELVAIDGTMNGEAFHLDGVVNPQTLQVTVCGDTPGGPVEETIETFAGGFNVTGTVGSVPFRETLNLNPLGALTGRLATIEGEIGGEPLRQELQLASDGQSVVVKGQLGKRPIDEVVSRGQDGKVVIHGTVGALTVEEVVDKLAP